MDQESALSHNREISLQTAREVQDYVTLTKRASANGTAKQESSAPLRLAATAKPSVVIYANEGPRVRGISRGCEKENERESEQQSFLHHREKRREPGVAGRKRTHELIMATCSSFFALIPLPRRRPFCAARAGRAKYDERT